MATFQLEDMLITLRNNIEQPNDSLDQFILDVLSKIEPEKALWNNRQGLGLALYTRCIEIIYFCHRETKVK